MASTSSAGPAVKRRPFAPTVIDSARRTNAARSRLVRSFAASGEGSRSRSRTRLGMSEGQGPDFMAPCKVRNRTSFTRAPTSAPGSYPIAAARLSARASNEMMRSSDVAALGGRLSGFNATGVPRVDPGVRMDTAAHDQYSSAISAGTGCASADSDVGRRASDARSPCGSTAITGTPARTASSRNAFPRTVFPAPVAPRITTCRRSASSARSTGSSVSASIPIWSGIIPPPVGKDALPGSGIYLCRAFRRDAYGGGGGGSGGSGGGGGGSDRRRRLRKATATRTKAAMIPTAAIAE